MMRKILLLAFLLISSMAIRAQTIGDFRPIVGLTYGLEAENLGLTLGGEYLLLDDFATAPTYEFYFTDPGITFRNINVDFRYYFIPGQLSFYGLAGYGINTTQYPGELEVTKSGLNLGAGTVYRFMFADRIAAFGQVKYSFAGQKQFSGMGGLTYFFSFF